MDMTDFLFETPVQSSIVDQAPSNESCADTPLRSLQFGPLVFDGGEGVNLFALVDATLRTEVTRVFDLDVIDQPALCLFEGEAFETHAEAAPWLIDISTSDISSTDFSFHKDFFEKHWPTQSNVLIQTSASLYETKRHLRRYVQLPVIEDQKRRYFRFWDGRVLPDFLRSISNDGLRCKRMMLTDLDAELRYICLTDEGPVQFAPCPEALLGLPTTKMYLKFSDFDAAARREWDARCIRIAKRIMSDFESELVTQDLDRVIERVRVAIDRFSQFGFLEHAHLHFFATWSVLYGIGFEQADTTGRLQEICNSTGPEMERFAAFRDWFDTFTIAV